MTSFPDLGHLADWADSLTRIDSLTSIADSTLTFILRHLPGDQAALALHRPDLPEVPSMLWLRNQPQKRIMSLSPTEARQALSPAAKTLLNLALLSSVPLSIDDNVASGLSDIIAGTHTRSGIAIGLTIGGRVFGALAIGAEKTAQFGLEDIGFLRTVVALLSPVLAPLWSGTSQNPAGGSTAASDRKAHVSDQQRQQLAQHEKLAALGSLMAGIAHEINNPLQSVLISLQIARETAADGQPIDVKPLALAEQEVRRLQRLSSQLLNLARPDRQQITSFNLNDLINDVLSLTLKQLQHEHIQVHLDLPPVPNINGNSDQIKQVILNLVINGLQAMPNGGSLSLATKAHPGRVSLTVDDTGTGIPVDVLPHIFDQFFTTKPDGTGLGLPLSQQMIQQHGGQIETQSAVGQGTRMTIWLPIDSVAT